MKSHKTKASFLLIPMLVLILFGIIMIGSADGWVYDPRSFDIDPLMIRQFVGLLIGLVLIFLIQHCSYDVLKLLAVPLFLGSVILLVVVLFFGTGAEEGDGVRRWLGVSTGISVQPSEIAKVAQILLFATLFDRLQDKMDRFWLIALLAFLALISLFLIYREPDLSTTLVLFTVTLACFFAAGVSGWYILIVVLLILIGGFIIYQDALSSTPHLLNPYQVERILAWLSPEDYALTTAYQTVQSRMAIGSGGLFGKGLFQNSGLVPIAATDFIFGIIGEELGLVGCLSMILLYLWICIRILWIGAHSEDLFGKIICSGVAIMIGFQAVVHMGVTTALLPNTGLPLPFVSYGLSSLIANMVGIGLVLRINIENYTLRNRGYFL